jgi:D-alanyl-D-alanine carboxypeptidase
MLNSLCKGLGRLFLLAFVAALVLTSAPPAAFARHHHRHHGHHSYHYYRGRHGRHRHAYYAPEPNRYSAIVIDADTGYVFSEKDADVKRYPASLSKMMTLYLVFEALENGTANRNQRLPISANAQYQEPSKLGLLEGYTIRLEDAIYGVVTRSANDAAVTLAEGLGGSDARFARLMTAKAQMLGMTHTHFVNATGLHDPSQYSTARDMSILARALVRDFPREYRYFSTPSFTFAGITSINHNHLMASYYGMDGIKTGYVNASGYNLAASAVRNGHRIIGVVFGGRTAGSRNRAMTLLLDSAFDRLRDPRLLAYLSERSKNAAARLPHRRPSDAEQTAAYKAAAAESGGEGDENEPQQAAPSFTPNTLNTQALNAQAPAQQSGLSAAEQLTRATPQPDPQAHPKPEAESDEPQAPTRLAAADTPLRPPAPGTWAVQIGAYSSHDAGLMALRDARARLPKRITDNSKYLIVPLMTNRGMIYRARLAGLDRQQAAQACKTLRGSCVILATE